jgi:hypothetical protein
LIYFDINGIDIMEHQKANRSNVSILNALSPNIILGKGVVPPAPRTKHIIIENPQNKNLGYL